MITYSFASVLVYYFKNSFKAWKGCLLRGAEHVRILTCVVYVTMVPDSMRCAIAGLENRIMYSLSDLLQKTAAGGGIQVPD